MDPIEFELEVRPAAWSTNQDRRVNPYKRAEMIAMWKQGAMLAYRKWRLAKPADRSGHLTHKGIITVTIPFDEVRTRDPHNYCGTVVKAVVDGIVKAGAWPDDDPRYVGHREPILIVGRKIMPLVLIEFDDAI